ncbi:MAG: DUF1801 domain-containing protein [Bacteroidota bacterium]|nr:DUF1801 domain-containing protein [Bacteroidota bacterium]MDP3144665.1 DUF1801 domain-containing protein [Bacteroidota bacterium]
MATTKHVEDASLKVTEYIDNLPDWSNKICKRLRKIILKSDPKIIEDWKWGPNYYLEGMICGFGAFQKHVSLAFFQGTFLKDKRKILQINPGNLHNRHLKFRDVKEINEDILLEYLIEAIDNNKKGKILVQAKDKTVIIAADTKLAFKSAGILNYFESLAYSHKKEYNMWIEDAKKEETRKSRIEKAIAKLASKEMMHDKYKK